MIIVARLSKKDVQIWLKAHPLGEILDAIPGGMNINLLLLSNMSLNIGMDIFPYAYKIFWGGCKFFYGNVN